MCVKKNLCVLWMYIKSAGIATYVYVQARIQDFGQGAQRGVLTPGAP